MLNKERRDDIRLWLDGLNVPGASADDLRALLDLADERDRYREAVKQAKTELWRCRSDMAVMLVDDDGGIPDEGDQQRLADIEQAALACGAALEGKHD